MILLLRNDPSTAYMEAFVHLPLDGHNGALVTGER